MDQTTAGLRLAGDYGGGSNPLVDIGYYTGGTVSHANWVNRLRVQNNGNVGIGTTSPGAKLDVVENTTAVATLRLKNISSTGYSGIEFLDPSNNVDLYIGLEANGGGSRYNSLEGGHRFYISSTEKVRINTDGNVGIGTTSPGSKLHVVGTTGSNTIIKAKGVTGNNNGASFYIEKASDTSTLTAYGDTASISGGTPDQSATIWTNTSIPLLFNIGGSERVRITSDGNVGIGTSSPSFKLSVQGIAQARGGVYVTQASPTNTLILDADNTSLHKIYTNSTVDLSLGTNSSTSQVYLQNGGNVGIGTTSPTHKLDIRGDVVIKGDSTQHSVLRFRRSDVSAYDFAYIGFENPALANDTFLISSAGNGNPLKLQAGASDEITFFGNTVEYARFNGNGNLGIGTTSPTSQLHVVGNVQLYGTSGGNININTAASGNGDISFDGSTFTIVSNSSSAPIVLSTNSTERMRIISNGNVGIGTSSPGVKLDVIGGVRSFSSAGNYGLITNGSFQAVGDHGGTFMLDLDNTGAADLVNVKKSGTSRFYIKNDGNVGIGTTAPADKLDVVGTIRTDKLRSNGVVYLGITGAKSSNATSFNMFDINNTGGNQTIEIVLSHHHSGGGQHGSFRRTILALNSYTDFIVLEDTSTNFGGGLGFTITRTSAGTIRIGWAGASSYANNYTFIGWIKGNGDYSVTNVGMDSLDAA